MKPIAPPPGSAVLVEVVAMICMTALVALGKLPSEGVLALATLTVSGYAFARARGDGPPPGGSAATVYRGQMPVPAEALSEANDGPPPSLVRRVAVLVVLLVFATGAGRLIQVLGREAFT